MITRILLICLFIKSALFVMSRRPSPCPRFMLLGIATIIRMGMSGASGKCFLVNMEAARKNVLNYQVGTGRLASGKDTRI